MTSHYSMLDYIHTAPQALAKTLETNEDPLQEIVAKVRSAGLKRIVISGVGSSYTAGMIAQPVFFRFCPLPAFILPSTEIGAFQPGLIDHETLVVAVSRSGERGWVVDSFREAIQQGAQGVAITGTANSLLAQNAPITLLTGEGPETSFPKTKSVVTSAGLLARLALALTDPSDPQVAQALEELQAMPATLEAILQACEPQVQALFPTLQPYQKLMLAGTLGNYGVALEGTLKMQEASGVTVVGNETGNLLHGPWGVAGSDWLVTLLVSEYDRPLAEVVLRLAGKVGAARLVIAAPGLDLGSLAEYVVTLPVNPGRYLEGLAFLPPIQLLTYYWAIANNLNPDTPANMHAILDAMLPPGRQEPEMRDGETKRQGDGERG